MATNYLFSIVNHCDQIIDRNYLAIQDLHFRGVILSEFLLFSSVSELKQIQLMQTMKVDTIQLMQELAI